MIPLHDRIALLVIDMQGDFVEPGAMAVQGAAELAQTLVPILASCRKHSVPIVFVIQQLRGDGRDAGRLARFAPIRNGALRQGSGAAEVVKVLEPEPDEPIVIKRRFSGFFGTDLDLLLRSMGVTQVAIAGVATHICCDMTARDAAQHGYDVLWLSDGVANGALPDMGFGPVAAEEVRRVALTTIAQRFGELCSVAEFMGAVGARPLTSDAENQEMAGRSRSHA